MVQNIVRKKDIGHIQKTLSSIRQEIRDLEIYLDYLKGGKIGQKKYGEKK